MADNRKDATTYLKITGKDKSIWKRVSRQFWTEVKRPFIAFARYEISQGKTIGDETREIVIEAIASIKAFVKRPQIENARKIATIEKELAEAKKIKSELNPELLERVRDEWSLSESESKITDKLLLRSQLIEKLKKMIYNRRLLITIIDGQPTFILQKQHEIFDDETAYLLAMESLDLLDELDESSLLKASESLKAGFMDSSSDKNIEG
jgi:hypothetical protein